MQTSVLFGSGIVSIKITSTFVLVSANQPLGSSGIASIQKSI